MSLDSYGSQEELQLSNYFYLGVFLTIITLQILSIIGNGLIIVLFIRYNLD
jgi:hypothetical protein